MSSIKHYADGDLVWAKLGSGKSAKKLKATVKASANGGTVSSVEIEETIKGLDNKESTRRYIHRQLMPASKLSTRVE